MEGFDLFHTQLWQPFAAFGFTGPLYTFNADTIINTWVLLALLLLFLVFTRFFILNTHSVARFLILSYIQSFVALIQQTMNGFSFEHFCFVTAMFTFILGANCLMLVPFFEEPTQDLNTTLALGIIAFLYIQASAIRAHGILEYIKEYFVPFFIMFPLHVVGKLATIISMSFRLFGNIFGGATIAGLWFNAIKGSIIFELLALPINFLILAFFGFFEGFLQAFVFTMLTLTYLSIAIQGHEFEPAKEHV